MGGGGCAAGGPGRRGRGGAACIVYSSLGLYSSYLYCAQDENNNNRGMRGIWGFTSVIYIFTEQSDKDACAMPRRTGGQQAQSQACVTATNKFAALGLAEPAERVEPPSQSRAARRKGKTTPAPPSGTADEEALDVVEEGMGSLDSFTLSLVFSHLHDTPPRPPPPRTSLNPQALYFPLLYVSEFVFVVLCCRCAGGGGR